MPPQRMSEQTSIVRWGHWYLWLDYDQIYVENNKSNYYIYLYRDQYKLEYGNEEINI